MRLDGHPSLSLNPSVLFLFQDAAKIVEFDVSVEGLESTGRPMLIMFEQCYPFVMCPSYDAPESAEFRSHVAVRGGSGERTIGGWGVGVLGGRGGARRGCTHLTFAILVMRQLTRSFFIGFHNPLPNFGCSS